MQVSQVNLMNAFAKSSLTTSSSQQSVQMPSLTEMPHATTQFIPSCSAIYTDSTIDHTTSANTQGSVPPFRLSVQGTVAPAGLPNVLLNGQPPPMAPTGNTGYFAPVIAPYVAQPTYNHITGQYINTATNSTTPPSIYHAGVQLFDNQRNHIATQLGGPSYYAEATLKGPRLEIPLFDGT